MEEQQPKNKMKSIFSSSTFWSIVLLCLMSIDAPVQKMLKTQTAAPEDVWAVLIAVVVTIQGVIGRYNAGNVYTPRYLPGQNKPEEDKPDT